jgi:hypothetical protein
MLTVAQRDKDARLEAWALFHLGLDLLRRGATQKALELLGRAWTLAKQTGDQGLRDRVGQALHEAGARPPRPSVGTRETQPPASGGEAARVPPGDVPNPALSAYLEGTNEPIGDQEAAEVSRRLMKELEDFIGRAELEKLLGRTDL